FALFPAHETENFERFETPPAPAGAAPRHGAAPRRRAGVPRPPASRPPRLPSRLVAARSLPRHHDPRGVRPPPPPLLRPQPRGSRGLHPRRGRPRPHPETVERPRNRLVRPALPRRN